MADGASVRSHAVADATRELRHELAGLEQRARLLPPGSLRHDVTNAVGAARSALALFVEEPEAVDPAHILDIARRNIACARNQLNDEKTSDGNQRNDLGGADERDYRNALGL